MAEFYNNINNNVAENAEFEKNLPDSPASDCESGVTGGSSSSATAEQPPRRRRIIRLFDESLAFQINPNDSHYKFIEHRFIDALTTSLTTTTAANTGGGDANVKENFSVKVVAIHRRNWWNDVLAKARAQSFQTHLKAMHYKLNNGVVVDHGEANLSASSLIHFAYFGGSISKIQQVLSRGFSFSDLQHNPNSAIFLSPDHSPAFSLDKSVEDEHGVRHLLLCRVLLGRSELIGPDSAQTEPSSEDYDSGIDDYNHPKKLIIWSTNMNTHILPEYVISFTLRRPPPPSPPPTKVYAKERNVARRIPMPIPIPNSPWITFPTLIAILSRRLPTDAIALITKYHDQYKEKRISRLQLVNIVRQIAGDRLLKAVIKSCIGARDKRMQSGFLRNRNVNK